MPSHQTSPNSSSSPVEPRVRVARHLDSQNESGAVSAVRQKLRCNGLRAKSECDYTAVEVERHDRVDILLVDSGWVSLASTAGHRKQLLADLPVPSEALAAILPGRLNELETLNVTDGTWHTRSDGVIVLDLTDR